MSAVVLFNESLNAIYTVLLPSHHPIVCACVDVHVTQFVGLALFPYAICTVHPTHQSVGHVIFNVTLVEFVCVALLFITKLHHTGPCLSILIWADVFIDSTFHNVSVDLYLTYCDAHVVPIVHVTFAVVPVVAGVHDHTVSIQ